jgi:hypothetical protein
MKKSEKLEWTTEAQDAFNSLKKVLSTSPVLVSPQDRDPMLLYIAATIQVVSTVLVIERAEEGKVHGVFTTLARYLHRQNNDILITRSWHMPYGGQRANYDITSQSIRSSLSLKPH